MDRIHLAPLFPLLLSLAAGCGAETIDDLDEDDDNDVRGARDALLASNSLIPNAMAPNAMAPNAMAPNAMAPNAMAPNAMAPNALAAIQSDSPDGALSRQLLQYTVSCALTPDQSFAFSWTETGGTVHNEVYPGLLGIAPGWATAPLTDQTKQRLVSSCLAARANWYGSSVLISLRSRLDPLRTHVQSPELAAFSHVEGAFFGNIFSSTPKMYACYEDSTVELARAMNRDCAAGHVDENGQVVDCGGIEILGSCDDWCHNLDNHERWYHHCDDPDGTSSGAAVAVALP